MRRTLLAFSALLMLAAPAAGQTCPGFPERGVQIIDALYDAPLAQGTDDDRRALTRKIVEQLVFEFPNDGWTWKSADPGRPPSKDSISREVNGLLCNWDWQNGSTRKRSVNAGQPGDNITGQNPIRLPGVNHLTGPQPGGGGGGVPVPADQVAALRAQVASLSADVATLREHLTTMANTGAAQLEAYQALAALVEGLQTDAAQIEGLGARLHQLELRPVPDGCDAAINIGARIGISCRLRFPDQAR
jgi:hypothetical protein